MDEDPELVVVQDPLFSQLHWSPKKRPKRKEQEKLNVRYVLAEMVLDLTGLPPDTIDLTPRN